MLQKALTISQMSCTVQNPNQVTWLRTDQKNSNQPVYIWYDEESMDRDVFDVATRTSGSTTIYELMASNKSLILQFSKQDSSYFTIFL